MMSVPEFLKLANERSRTAPVDVAIVDLGHVQNIDDPTVHSALTEHLRHLANDAGHHHAALTSRQLALLGDDGGGQRLEGRLRELDETIRKLGIGAVHIERFVLPRDRRAFADRVQTAMESGRDQAARLDHESRLKDLAHLLQTEQMLRRADIEPLLHHQAILDFAKPRHPVVLAHELTVSIPRLEERLGVALLTNDWLFEKTTALLDRRVLFHLVRDRRPHDEPYAINLRVATVLAPDFADFVDRLAAREHETLIVELAERDREADPAAFADALRELTRLGIHSAYHAGGWADLLARIEERASRQDGELPLLQAFDFVKVAAGVQPADDERARRRAVEAIGAERLILERVEAAEAIDAGLALGIRIFQGFGVSALIQERSEKERARAAAKTGRRAHQSADKAAAPPEPKGLLGKFLRRG